MYVLEGELTVYTPGTEVVVGPGEVHHTPKGVSHTYKVTSQQPARILEVSAPAGFERFVAAAGEPTAELTLPPVDAPEDFDQAIALAAEHGIEVLGPPGTLP